MKQSEFIKQVLAGKPLCLVEYRKTEGDEIRRKVVKAGESAVMPMAKHTVISDDKSFEVAEFLPDGAKIADIKAPYERGAVVAFYVDSKEETKFGARLTGMFLGKLEA